MMSAEILDDLTMLRWGERKIMSKYSKVCL